MRSTKLLADQLMNVNVECGFAHSSSKSPIPFARMKVSYFMLSVLYTISQACFTYQQQHDDSVKHARCPIRCMWWKRKQRQKQSRSDMYRLYYRLSKSLLSRSFNNRRYCVIEAHADFFFFFSLFFTADTWTLKVKVIQRKWNDAPRESLAL